MDPVDATEADPRGPDLRGPGDEAGDEAGDEVGTQAASPHAIAHVTGGAEATAILEARPSRWATVSKGQGPTAAQALDKADLPRMRMFHLFGVVAPLGAVALSLIMGGDPLARTLFWIGAGILALANVGLVWLTGTPARWQPRPVGVLWVISTTAVIPMLYYFGPFSAAVMIEMLGIVFISLGRSRVTSLVVAGICIGGHLLLARDRARRAPGLAARARPGRSSISACPSWSAARAR